MRIGEVYESYSIPLNLRRHMLQVAGVGKIVCDNLLGVVVNGELVVKTLLLHDMGNLIKYDFKRVNFFIDEDKGRVGYYKHLREDWVKKYGKDADEATLKIIGEVTGDERSAWLCEHSHGDNIREILGSQAWEQKIAYYADMRVGPFEILSVRDRFDDLEARYSGRECVQERYGDPLKVLKRFRRECLEVERQLQEIAKINLKKIDDEMVEGEIAGLRKVEV